MKLEHLNPSVKAGTVLLAVILLSFQYLVSLNAAVFLLSILALLFFSDAKPRAILLLLLPAFTAAFGMFMMGLYYARGSSITDAELTALSAMPYAVRAAMSQNLYTAAQLGTRLLAYAGLGMAFALSTNGEHFVSSLMHQCRLSPKFAYGILAAFHLMPTMAKEYKSVRLAFAVRGMHTHALSVRPMFTMLVNSIRWSEAVAMAMESKGFSGTAERTYCQIPRVRWYDWCFSICIIGAILGGMLMLRF